MACRSMQCCQPGVCTVATAVGALKTIRSSLESEMPQQCLGGYVQGSRSLHGKEALLY